MTREEARAFILANTRPAAAPLVPELVLRLATEITPIWQATEDFLALHAIPPPFWAFAWPGSQVLARMVLDRAELVRGLRVLDFAAGCGLAALAAARAGAEVEAAEIDPLAIAAIEVNAAANALAVAAEPGDVVGAGCRWDVILCGDVCYEAPMTRHILPWLRQMSGQGALVWVADPGRAYLPREGLEEVSRTDVPTSLELEDRPTRRTVIYRLTQI